MAKINKKEYHVLKGLDDRWKWIARDSYRDEKEYENVLGGIRVFSKKPFKRPRDDHFGVDGTGMGIDWLYLDRDMFFFIKPYDDKPYNIAELIEEYEIEQHIKESVELGEQAMRDHARKEVRKESEETEVKKDIEWLEDEILTDMRYLEGNREIPQLDIKYQTLREVAQKIHSLDEPEVLSQEWIDENEEQEEMYGSYGVPVHKLQNLLVPKQEELETKIQELIEVYKQEEDAYSNPENGWISGFIGDLESLLEEEQKYRVLDGNTTLLGRINGLMLPTVEILEYYPEYAPTFEFTEQEIKNFDPRYWPFAVKVEEMEE